jgi:hypothetical protein
MGRPDVQDIRDPDFKLGGLSVWIHGRQFPDAVDYWDANWLRVTAHCRYPSARVSADGSIIHLGEIAGLLRGLEELHKTLSGKAVLDCIEPNIRIALESTGAGHISARIDITPDHMAQSHRFEDEIDQTMLPPVIAACKRILDQYPIKDPDRVS